MFCSNCGVQVNEGAKFCDKCGTPMEENIKKIGSAFAGAAPKTMGRLGGSGFSIKAPSRAPEPDLTPEEQAMIAELKRLVDAGDASIETENYEEAVKCYTEALEIGEDAFGYTSRGLAFARMGKTQEALTDLNTAIQMNPELGLAYCYRGDLYRLSGSIDAAIVDYKAALNNGFETAEVYKYLGFAYKEKSAWSEAAECLAEAMRRDGGNDYDTLFVHAAVSVKLEDYESVIIDCDRALPLVPKGAGGLADKASLKAMRAAAKQCLQESDGDSEAEYYVSEKKWPLAFFLAVNPVTGILGLHRLYTRKRWLVYVITLGGVGIWWLIDVLALVFGKFKDRGNFPVVQGKSLVSFVISLVVAIVTCVVIYNM